MSEEYTLQYIPHLNVILLFGKNIPFYIEIFKCEIKMYYSSPIFVIREAFDLSSEVLAFISLYHILACTSENSLLETAQTRFQEK